MIDITKVVQKILALDAYDRQTIAEEVGVDYATVCRWASGASKTTRHEYAQRLANLWTKLVSQGHIETDESEEYVVGEGETMDVSGTQQVRIINHGLVRINVHHHHEHPQNK